VPSVPEPPSIVVLGAGLLCLTVMTRLGFRS
jgi:hypothetical protein